ncbi:MAG: hypothetical protein AB7F89_14175 [Pirellulaceae bacterium]
MPTISPIIQIGQDEAGNLAIQTKADVTTTLGMLEQVKFALLSQVNSQPPKRVISPDLGHGRF